MNKLNNENFNYHHDEDEIDIKEIFTVLLRYKKSILFIAFLSLLFTFPRAYFAEKVYTSETLIQIAMDDPTSYIRDLVNPIANGDMVDQIEDELIILSSSDIAKKTLATLNIGTRYFTTKYLKTEELYNDSPFIVRTQYIAEDLETERIFLIPISNNNFRLLIEETWKTKLYNKIKLFFMPKDDTNTNLDTPITYDKIHSFSKEIHSEWFTIIVEKTSPLENQHYSFSVQSNESMVDFVQGGISASPASKFGNIISLTFSDNVALRANDIISRVANAYIDKNLQLISESAEKQLQFLDIQIEAINKSVEGSATKLQSFKATNIVVDLSEKAKMTANDLRDFERELYELNIEITIMENVTQQLRSQKDTGSITADYSRQINASITRLLSEIQTTTSKYVALTVKHTKLHPEVIITKKRINSLKKSLREAMEGSLDALKKRQTFLVTSIEKKQNTLKSFPSQEQKLDQLNRTFLVNDKIYSYLLDKRAEIALLKASTVSDSRIIEKAYTKSATTNPNPKLIILVGLILGLILGISQAFLRSFLDNKIKTVEDIEKLTNIPLYASLPLITTEKSKLYYNEAMRTFWVNIEFFKTRTPNFAKVVSFTSSISGEGKTHTIYNFAKSITNNTNKRVIILDLDMRRPTLHEQFNIPNSEIGMSTLLAEKYSLLEAMQSTDNNNLQIITSGPRSPNPTGLIMSHVLEDIIKNLSTKYDYILLDTPPIGIVADAKKIIHISDLTLVLLKSNYSKKEFVQEINQLVLGENPHIGIILNGIDFKKGNKYNSKYTDDYYIY